MLKNPACQIYILPEIQHFSRLLSMMAKSLLLQQCRGKPAASQIARITPEFKVKNRLISMGLFQFTESLANRGFRHRERR